MDKTVLGERIRIARERRGLSQEEFAARISRDQRAVSEYEHGKRRISVNELPLFAVVLDVPLMYFFEGDIVLDDVDNAVLDELRRLPNSAAKRSALELMRVLRGALEQQR
ncbi:MAG: helix-turn-helix transcriptional regulator [Anaerolineae bacterium]|nr:helix-turn-helix transcriptional regulator [Anaerolineae bacterium]